MGSVDGDSCICLLHRQMLKPSLSIPELYPRHDSRFYFWVLLCAKHWPAYIKPADQWLALMPEVRSWTWSLWVPSSVGCSGILRHEIQPSPVQEAIIASSWVFFPASRTFGWLCKGPSSALCVCSYWFCGHVSLRCCKRLFDAQSTRHNWWRISLECHRCIFYWNCTCSSLILYSLRKTKE